MSDGSPRDTKLNLHRAQNFHNRPLLLIWSGQTISGFGDAFFNLAVMWVVYTQSGSILQTAVVQIVWHLSDVLFGPIAGVLADRWERKTILVTTNLLAAGVVGAVAAVLFTTGNISFPVAIIAIFALNTVTTFAGPSRASILPAIVDRNLLATVWGWFSTVGQISVLVGSAAAGIVVSLVGAAWAVVVDALSFVLAALLTALAPLPKHAKPPTNEQRPSMFQDARSGWRVIASEPVVRVLVWLGVLVNVPSFTGPLYPALVNVQLGGGVAAYGSLQAVSVAGGLAGGALAGYLERRLGAGRLLATGWGIAGVATVGIAFSNSLPLTLALVIIVVFGLAVGGIASGVLTMMLIPDEFRGRAVGITRAISVIAIPISTAIGGWLADRIGVAPLFAFAGVWTFGVAALAWANTHVRTARI